PYVIVFLHSPDPPTTTIYTLSLHDALPISNELSGKFLYRVISTKARTYERPSDIWPGSRARRHRCQIESGWGSVASDRPAPLSRSEEHSLNSSHLGISYAVFCLKKKACSTR